jgi:signal transduction histidine kinase
MLSAFLVCFYITARSLKHSASRKEKAVSVIWCLLLAVVYAARPHWATRLMVLPVYCVASILFIRCLARIKLRTAISAFMLSFGISFILYYIAAFPAALLFAPTASRGHVIGAPIDFDTPVQLAINTLAAALRLPLAFLLFRIKRFRSGFPFLSERYAVVVALIAAGIVLGLSTWMRVYSEAEDLSAAPLLLVSIIIVGAGIFIWIRLGIKAAYLRWAKDNNEGLYRQEIAEKDAEIRRLTDLSDALRSANHSIIHRLAALERGYAAMLEAARNGVFPMDDEGGITAFLGEGDIAASLEDVRRALRDYKNEAGRGGTRKPLPTTKIKMLDDLFALFAERCKASQIEFDLIVNGSIPYMVEHILEQGELETMVGDLLQNALVAIDAGSNPFRSVLAVLGLEDGHYALTVFDSGIPFEVGTLARLGLERVTTHADDGGTGVGFMKTFEFLREYAASLVISAREPGSAGHTKSVKVLFDGEGRYVIETYRPSGYPKGDRYVIADASNG